MYRFRLKLTIVMIVFALFISLTNTIIDYYRLKEETVKNNEFQIQQIETRLIDSMENIEKAYYFFEKDTERKLESITLYLIELYEENSNFDLWDFTALKEHFGVDIYILNEHNVITHSSFPDDIGLNFTACCGKLSKVLDERRNSGDFFSDGMDIEQKTGELKKYSYMATPDKKFLIELGYSLQGGTIFNEFNFLQVKKEMEEKYSSLNEVNILNVGGFSIGEPVDETRLSKERRDAFEKTLQSRQPIEIKGSLEGKAVTYRYVPYVSNFDEGFTKVKVIEIVHNQRDLEMLLQNNVKTFIGQFLIVLMATILIATAITRWVSRPMYLAFHDSLTGLKNRAAFNELLCANLEKNKGTFALMIIDLDDFKLVNDHFGHHTGDKLLKLVAHKIQLAINRKDIAIRLGGDEFVILLPDTNKTEVEQVAKKVVESIKKAANQMEKGKSFVSASIGISIAPDHGDAPETLFNKADQALYDSKKKGKNQYQFYD